MLQRIEGLDPITLRHKELPEANRDSLSYKKFEDGHIEGTLHDSVENTDTKLYSPDEVLATIAMLQGMHGDFEQLIAQINEHTPEEVAHYLGRAGLHDTPDTD